MNDSPLGSDNPLRRLVRYFHDCLAAQSDWARAINVIDQKDVALVPLAASEQQQLGTDGCLRMADPDAVDLAKRVTAGGRDASLFLGALFIVGRIAAKADRAEKRFCGPLLEVTLMLRGEGDGQIVVQPAESEFTVNYSLVGELLGRDDDDLQDRLSDLAELVPDFPIDADEFATFWDGFLTIAPELQLAPGPPSPRKSNANRSTRIADLGLASEPDGEILHEAAEADSRGLEMIDFFVPEIPGKGAFQLLPATAIVYAPKAGRPMSALSELRAMETMPLGDTALGAMMDPPSAAVNYRPTPRAYPDDVQPLGLTPAQHAIVESSRSAPLTVVTGPPGTGKSYTITAIVLDALLNGETVLVASQMDKAVEVVAEQTESLAGPLAIARTGGRAAQRQLANKLKRLTGPVNRLETVTSTTIDQCAARHYDLTRQLQELQSSFQQVIESEREWSRSFLSFERSKQLSPLPIEEVKDAHVRKAERLIRRAESNVGSGAGWLRRHWGRWQIAGARRLLKVPAELGGRIDELNELLRFHLLLTKIRGVERHLRVPFPANLAYQEIAKIQQRRRQTAIELLRLMRTRQLRSLVSDQGSRAALRDLATLLRRRKSTVKRQLREKVSADVLLQSFPAWACTSRSLCEVLPATPALFDIVVIDEASQCDLALASVALMRAKRAVVVGDPHQLRHVCFLSRAREQAAVVRSGITPELQQRFGYRRSLFDVAADMVDQRHFFFLDEHFRSHPQIIEFSNRRFYDDSLRIMTSRPSRTAQSAIEILRVEGQRQTGSSVNSSEVDAVVETVRSIVRNEGTGKAMSIGVVSPFREHADAITERVLSEFTSEVLAKHSIVIGTAHSLQGDEKDLIILSTSIDAGSHPGTLRFLEAPNLFNVAVTRARRKLVVVTSVDSDQLPAGLLRDFLVHATQGWSPRQSADESDSVVEAGIAEQLRGRKVEIWTGFRSAGTRINLVAGVQEDTVAVLCDDDSEMHDSPQAVLESQIRLTRAGWTVTRIPHRTLQADRGACLEEVVNQRGKNSSRGA